MSLQERLVEAAEQAVEDLANRRVTRPLMHVLPRHDVLRDAHLRIEGLRLGDGPHVDAGVDGDPTGVRRFQSCHEVEQGALARAIATHHGDALALTDAE